MKKIFAAISVLALVCFGSCTGNVDPEPKNEVEPKNAAEPKIVSKSNNLEIDLGQSATFSVEAISTDGGKISYQWFTVQDEEPSAINNSTDSSLTVTPEAEGTFEYRVQVTNTIDNTQSSVWESFELKVNTVIQQVQYTVKHCLQNAENDEYTVKEVLTLKGLVGEQTQAVPNTYTGFNSGTFTNTAIKQDGTTVVEIKYDRIVVTLSFNSNGGSTVEAVSGKYDATVNVDSITVPTKTGYTFDSWSPAIPSTFPVSNGTYTAQWKANEYKVTLEPIYGTTDAGTTSFMATYGSDFSSITIPSRTCYKFNGYYTEYDEDFNGTGKFNGTGTQYISSTGNPVKSWDITEDTTLYANWIYDGQITNMKAVAQNEGFALSWKNPNEYKYLNFKCYDDSGKKLTDSNLTRGESISFFDFTNGKYYRIVYYPINENDGKEGFIWVMAGTDVANTSVQNLVATPAAEGAIISWDPLHSYSQMKITYKDEDGNSDSIYLNQACTSYELKELVFGKQYTITVSGINSEGEEFGSASVTTPFTEEARKVSTVTINSTSYDIVEFGDWPQTVKSDSVTIDESKTFTRGNFTFYKGSDYNMYVKCLENAYELSSPSYSNGTSVSAIGTGTYSYFKVEPIKWRVLTKDYNGTGNALLLAQDALTANVQFYVDLDNRTINSKTIYPNNYKYSTVRAYLNGNYESDDTQSTTYKNKGFLQTAFTGSAQLLIKDTTVDNTAASTTDASGTVSKATSFAEINTTDKIFLLSEKEVTTTTYGFDTYNTSADARVRNATDYAKANYALQETSGCYWWLRSPDASAGVFARVVLNSGKANDYFNTDNAFRCVVPALTIHMAD